MKQVKALAAFSGGLDGMLASKILVNQGIYVEAITFDSPFFDVSAGRKAALVLDIPWRAVDFTKDIVNLLFSPPSGFGKNMNPCIDCHATMFRRLKELALAEGFDFIFSGEVVGQRPMSQNRSALNRVKKISETGDILLRPLSAKLLPPTVMEEKGLVDREKLLDISGRGRKRQIAMAKDFLFSHIPSPGGGCLLTDPGYAKRLKALRDANLLTGKNARMIKFGRMFLLDEAVGLIGRNSEENLEMLETEEGIQLDIQEIPGPLGILFGKVTQDNLVLLTSIMASYTKADKHKPVVALTNDGRSISADVIDVEERAKYSVLFKL